MALALAILSAAMVVFSMYGVLLPHRLIRIARDSMAGGFGLWLAVAVRLLFAALLWFAAPVSHTPAVLKVLAALLLLTAIVLPIAGQPRLMRFIAFLASRPPWAIRGLCLPGVALGGFLLWSISSAIGAA